MMKTIVISQININRLEIEDKIIFDINIDLTDNMEETINKSVNRIGLYCNDINYKISNKTFLYKKILEKIYPEYKIIDKQLSHGYGEPDFLLVNELLGNIAIEIKLENDKLHENQLQWMINNKSRIISKVMYIKITNEDAIDLIYGENGKIKKINRAITDDLGYTMTDVNGYDKQINDEDDLGYKI